MNSFNKLTAILASPQRNQFIESIVIDNWNPDIELDTEYPEELQLQLKISKIIVLCYDMAFKRNKPSEFTKFVEENSAIGIASLFLDLYKEEKLYISPQYQHLFEETPCSPYQK